MTPPRKRKPRPLRTISGVTTLSSLGGGGELRLREAADIIAAGARGLAAGWSRTVPQSIHVAVGTHVAIISATAPVARPAELRLKHPLFGDREHWYPPPGEPFLAPAAAERMDAALAQWAKKIDDMARKAGFR